MFDSRRVQSISIGFLLDLWRYSFGIDAADQFPGVARIGLWESPTGLLFFDPPIAGDRTFYRRFYKRIDMHQRIAGAHVARNEFVMAASYVPNGAKLLDVGCGEGGFRRFVPTADYTGLDPNFGETNPYILPEEIGPHAAAHPEAYDVVCNFQVLEHVADPLAFARLLVSAVRPGGRLLIGVPCWPSLMTGIPNLVVNGPPHHLTLWNERALETLCDRLGLVRRAIAPIRTGPDLSVPYWMGRCAPKFRSERLFRHAWSWHAGLVWAYCAGRVLNALFPVPANAAPLTMLLVADKPA
jgi:SAM-dependent methyltransferase